MSEPRIIAALVYPGYQLLDVVGPLEAFNIAAQQLIDDGDTRDRVYQIELVGKKEDNIRSLSGMSVEIARSLDDDAGEIDTLFVPGALSNNDEFYTAPDYIRWLQDAAPKVRRMCSVCSGALLLAATGLLDGRRATTHWMDAPDLRERFPDVRVEENQIYVEDRGVYTSGGITAGIDLALALIEQDYSRRLALRVAKRLLVFLKRPGDQLQFNSFLSAQTRPTHFAALLDWVTENLDKNLTIDDLAQRACMSERTFRRKFEAEIGSSATRYITQARITMAQTLLETTDLPLSAVARRCGFKSPATLRYAFVSEFDVTPSDYRLRFGA